MEIVIAVIGSGALSALISGLFNLITGRRRKKDGVSEGVQQLLYDRIKYLAHRHIEKGAITAGDLEDIERMHSIYHDDLDGNGYLDDMMKAVRQLKII